MEWKLKPLVQVIKAIGATSAGSFMFFSGAHAAVDNFNVSSGSGNIARPDAKTTVVTQNSKVMVATVSRLDLAGNELLQHNAQLSGSSVLYKIQDVKASDIQGRIEGNANLKLMVLQNQNGMVFGPNSQVDVNSFVATTLDVDDAAFQSGKLILDGGNSTGVIVNKGLIQAATGGSVALVAGQVDNQGVIIAEKGHVELASGRAVTIDFDGDGLLQLRIEEETTAGSGDAVANSGVIEAQGGEVLLTAKAARDVFTHVVNNTGVIRAGRVSNEGGVIRLVGEGGDTVNSGTLVATSVDGKGGDIDVLGDRVALTGNAVVDASGETGGGTIRIGGDFQGKNPDISNASDTFVGKDVDIKADATTDGDGGRVIVWADKNTSYQGKISARGKGENGVGGSSEVSGKEGLGFTGKVDLSAESGEKGQLLLDPEIIEIVADGDIAALNQIDSVTIQSMLSLADVTLQSSSDIAVNAEVKINSASSLTLDATDNIHINKAINNAGTGDLNFTVGSSAVSQIKLGADVTTLGDQSYNGNVVLADDAKLTSNSVSFNGALDGAHRLRLNGDVSFSSDVGASESLTSIVFNRATDLAVDIFAGTQTFLSDLTLLDDVTLTGNLNAQAISGANNLIVDGDASLNGAVSINSLDITGNSSITSDVQTLAGQRYGKDITLGGDVKLEGSTVTTDGINGAHDLVVFGDLLLAGGGNLNSLVVRGTTELQADVTTTQNQTYNDVVLASNSRLTADRVKFKGTVDGAHRLILDADVNITNDIGSTESLTRVVFNKKVNLEGNISAANQTFMDSLTLNEDVILTGEVTAESVTGPFDLTIDGISGNASFAGAVDVNDLNVSGDTIFASDVHAKTVTIGGRTGIGGAINAESLNITGDTDLGADVTTGLDQVYGGKVVLTNDSKLTANTVSFNDAVDGAHTLRLNADVNLTTDVGASASLKSIVFNRATNLAVDVFAGSQTFLSDLSLANDVTLTGDVNAQVVAGAGNLIIDGNAALNGNVSVNSLTVKGSSTVIGDVTTTLQQSYAKDLTLGSDVQLSGTSISTQGISGGHDLTVIGDLLLADTVSVNDLSATGTTELLADVTTTRDQTYYGDVLLTGDARLTANNVNFGGGVNGAHRLILDAYANINNDIGATEALTSIVFKKTADLAVDIFAGTQTFLSDLNLYDDVTLAGNLNAQTITGGKKLIVDGNSSLNGPVSLNSLDVRGSSTINSDVTTLGNQSYAKEITLGGDVSLSGTNVTTHGISGDYDLAIHGDVVFGDAVSIHNLIVFGKAELQADIMTVLDQNYEGDVALASNSRLIANRVGFNGAVDGTHRLILDAETGLNSNIGATESLTKIVFNKAVNLRGNISAGVQTFNDSLTLADDVTLNGNVSAQMINGPFALTVSGDADLSNLVDISSLDIQGNSNLSNDVLTAGAQNYGGTLLLGNDVVLRGASVTTHGVSGVHNFIIDGTAVIDGAIDTQSLYVNGSASLGADVTTINDQTYRDAVTLTGDAVLTASSLNFNNSIDGAHRLELDAPVINLAREIGATQSLREIVFDQAIALGVDINADTQTFNDTLGLMDNIRLNGSVTAQTVNGPFALTVTGDADLNDLVDISSLDIQGNSKLLADVNTSGTQNYGGTLLLGNDVVLRGASVTTHGVNGAYNFTVDGAAVIDGAIGTQSLYVTGPASLGADVTTIADQIYMGAVTLTGDTLLTGAGLIFSDTIDGTHRLELDASAVNLTGNIGATQSLGEIVFDQAITLGVDIDAGTQTFMDSLTLSDNVSLKGNVTAQMINGPFALAVSGDADLSNLVDISSLDIQGNSNLSNDVLTAGAQNYGGTLLLGNDVVLRGASVTTHGVSGVHNFIIDGTAVIDGAIDTQSLYVNGSASLGADVTTINDQTYRDAVTLTGDAVLTASSLNFNNSIDGAHRLELDAPVINLAREIGATQSLREIVFDQAIALGVDINADTQTFNDTLGLMDNIRLNGSVTAQTVNGPFALTVTGDADLNDLVDISSLDIQGNSKLLADVNTSGTQNYGGTLLLGNDVVLRGASVTTHGVNGAYNFTVDGAAVIDGAIGTQSLYVTGPASLGADVTTIADQAYMGAVTLTGDTVLKGAIVNFDNTIDGAYRLELDALAVNLTGDIGTTLSLREIVFDQGTTLGVDINADTQTFMDSLVLTDNVTLGGNVTAQMINGPFSLTVDGNADLNNVVSTDSLSITGSTDLGGDISTVAGQLYGGPVSLSGDVRLTGSTVDFVSTVDGNHRLFLDAQVSQGDRIGGNQQLHEIVFAKAVDLTADISADVQTYLNHLSLSQDVLLTGEVTTQSVSGLHNLVIHGNANLDGDVTIDDLSVSGHTRLGSLVDAGGITIGGDAIFVDTVIADSLVVDGASDLAADITTTGAQTYNGGLRFSKAITLTGSDIDANGMTGAHNLAVSGNTVQHGTVSVKDLSISGNADFASTVDAGVITIGGNTAITDTVTADSLAIVGETQLGADVSTVASQTYGGAVTLTQDAVLSATTINFDSTVDGNHRLVLDAVVNMSADVGRGQQLSEVVFTRATELAGNLYAGVQTYMSDLTLHQDAVLNGDITAQSVIGPHNLMVNGDAKLQGVVSVNDLTVSGDGSFAASVDAGVMSIGGNALIEGTVTADSLTVGGSSNLAADIQTTGAQRYEGAVTLGDDITLTGSSITANGVAGSHNLTLNGDTNLQGAVDVNNLSVNGSAAFGSTLIADIISITGNTAASDTVTAGSLVVGGDAILAGDITTTGSQSYAGVVTLDNDLTLSGTTITAGGMTGTRDLTIDGDAAMQGAVFVHDLLVSGDADFGATVDAGAISIGGNTSISDAVSAETLIVSGTSDLAAAITTTGTQVYNGAVALSDTVILKATTVTASDVNGAQDLTITGDANLNGVVSVNDLSVTGNAAFASTVNARDINIGGNSVIEDTVSAESLVIQGTTDLGGDITTVAGQVFGGAVTLSNDSNLSATTIDFNSTVDGNHRLVLDAVVNLAGDMGADDALSEVVFNKATDLAVDIYAGVQTYMNGLSLSRNVTLTGDVSAQSVTGPHHLVVSGDADLNGAVSVSDLSIGGAANFASTVQARDVRITGNTTIHDLVTAETLAISGTTDLGADIATVGSQSYTGEVTLSKAVRLSGTKVSANQVSGPYNLTVAADADLQGVVSVNDLTVDGDATIGAAVNAQDIYLGGNTIIEDRINATRLEVVGTTDLGADISTTATQDYQGAITLNQAVTLTGSAVTTQAISGAHHFNVIGDVDVQDAVSVKDLSVTGDTAFASTVNAGDIVIGGNSVIGDVVKADSLSILGNTDLGADVTTVNAQHYTGNVRLTDDATLSATTVSFDGTVDGNHRLVLDAEVSLAGDMGAGEALSEVVFNRATDLAVDIYAGVQTYMNGLSLSRNVTLTGNVSAQSVTGPHHLLVSGDADLNGAVSVSDLSIGGAANFASTVQARDVRIAGNTTIHDLVTADTLAINGTTDLGADITTVGSQNYTGEVTLSKAVRLSGTKVSANQISGPYNLTVAADADLQGVVSVNDLTVNGDTTIGAAVNALDIYLGGNTIIADRINATRLEVVGTTDLGADISTTATQNYQSAVTLNQAVTLTGSAVTTQAVVGGHHFNVVGDADVKGVVSVKDLSVTGDAAFASTVNAGDIVIGGNSVIGDVVNAESLSIFGNTDLGADVTTVNGQHYTGNVRLTDDATLSATTVSFDGTVDGNHRLVLDAVVSLAGDMGAGETLSEVVFNKATDLAVDIYAGVQTYMSDLTLNGDARLTGDVSAQSVQGTNDLTIDGTALLSGAVTINDLTISGDADLASTVDAGAITIAGNAVINDKVSADSLEISGTSDIAADIATAGLQRYTGTVTLKDDVNLSASLVNANRITGGRNLSISGDANLNGTVEVNNLSVSGDAALASSVDAAVISILGSASMEDRIIAESLYVAGASDLAGDVTTTGAQLYAGPVKLMDDLMLSGSSVSINGVSGVQDLAIDGNAELTGVVSVNDLSVSGDADFAATVDTEVLRIGGNGAFYGAVNAQSLTVSGETALGGDITTVAGQSYDGAVSLIDSVNLAGSAITFGRITGNHSLTIQGDVELTSEVSAKRLSVYGNAELYEDVVTSENQLFSGAVGLNNDITLSGKDIAIGTVDGGYALTVNGSGFSTGDIGLNTALNELNIVSDAGFALQKVTVDGDLSLQSNGDIAAYQTLTIAGNLLADIAGDVNFENPLNDFNTVEVTARNASLRDNNSIVLNAVNTSGNLTVTAVDNISDNGHISVDGLGAFQANDTIDLGSWGASEETRFGKLAVSGLDQNRARKVTVIEEDSMHVSKGQADDLTLISELGSITTDTGLTLDVEHNLHLEVRAGENIGSANNPIDFTFSGINGDYSTSTLSLLGDNAFISTQASLLSVRLNTSGSSVLFRSALTDTVLSSSMIDFLNYLFGADEALFNEFVIIFDVKSDGIMLPEDQKDDIFAYIKEGGRSVGYIRQREKFKQLFDLWQKYDTVFTLTVPQRDMIAAG
ncbi:filamentous hemagglutinin N-terminal domain-containing protein [Amphritea pacifica]|uniref:Filamentous hemagglutinin N-terminal domain-containing protein n=1 Tax=Amphritea pacifica TaxID=2811233 RepID=A0ABS2W5C3_9GAMM|nr:filamentous hemagglutinin N-terminal domain-containing protein [Amphritea pacifica]MBN0986909.1 filamentous hemagglutinin N-terminal domain-containing protein [Amphritea pacifica]